MKLYKLLILIILLIGAVYGGKVFFSEEIEVPGKEVVVEVPRQAPVLDRIAGCETQGNPNVKGTHYAKNGQVLLSPNKDGSVDIGYYQINDDLWGKKASEMNLNLVVEADNKKFGEYLYATRGTQDWYLSAKCWNR